MNAKKRPPRGAAKFREETSKKGNKAAFTTMLRCTT